MNDLENYVDFLFSDGTGYAHVDIKLKDQSYNQHWFHWPEQKVEICDYIRTSIGSGDVYISPALYSEKSGKKEAVKNTKTVWVEFDGKRTFDLKGLPEPNVIVQTSTPDHIHCYWEVEKISPEAVEDINRRITYYLEADGSGWDITQVLRPPGTLNWKSQLKPLETKLIRLESGIKEASQFDLAPFIERPASVITYTDLVDIDKISGLNSDLRTRITQQIPTGTDRSSLLFSIGNTMAESGFSLGDIVSALYVVDCRIKKYVGRADQLHRLSQIAAIAIFKNTDLIACYSPVEIINHELELDWLIPGWLHSTGMLMLSGAPGVGKTQLSFMLAYFLSTGGSYIRGEIKPGKVQYWSLEMDITELKYIFKAQAQVYTNIDTWNQNMRVYYFDEPNYIQFENLLKEERPNVVFIDSLSELALDDLKEAESRRIMLWFKKMRRKYNVAFVVIHHNRKASDTNKRPNKLSDLYGSFQFAAKSETVLTLFQPEGTTYLELTALKARFSRKDEIRLHRTDNLTFTVSEAQIHVIDGPKSDSDSSNPFLSESSIGNLARHGNELH